LKRFGLLKKGELGFNFLATGLFVKCLKLYVMAYAPIAIARQSMSTKEIDRDLMFHCNKNALITNKLRVHKLIVLISEFFSMNTLSCF